MSEDEAMWLDEPADEVVKLVQADMAKKAEVAGGEQAGKSSLSLPDSEMVEKVVMGGDLSHLTSEERLEYYKLVCESIGLNPLTKPFDYLNLDGKMVLYANKTCAQQLVKKYHITLQIMQAEAVEDMYIVTTRASRGTQFVDAIGAVSIGYMKGNQKVNAVMKAQTKSHRRATLALVGLGMLDETEIETVEGATKMEVGAGGEVLDTLATPPPFPPEAFASFSTAAATIANEWANTTNITSDSIPILKETSVWLQVCPVHDGVPFSEKTNADGEVWHSHAIEGEKNNKGKQAWCNGIKALGQIISEFCKESGATKPKLTGMTETERAEWLEKYHNGKSDGFGAGDFIQWMEEVNKTPDEIKEALDIPSEQSVHDYASGFDGGFFELATVLSKKWDVKEPGGDKSSPPVFLSQTVGINLSGQTEPA